MIPAATSLIEHYILSKEGDENVYAYGQRCLLHSIAHGDGGALVAQGKNFHGSIRRPSGFSFLQCHIKGTGMPYLGRAWSQYSTVVYSRCQIDANIRPVGWYDWGMRDRER